MGRFFTNWKFTYAVALALLVAMVALRAWDPLPLKILRDKTFDVFQQIKPREPPPDGYPIGVRIIDLDDESLQALGQWPWPRTRVAALVKKLADDYHVAAVAFDIVFAEPDRTSPNQLVSTLEDLTPQMRAELLSLPDNDEVLAQTIANRPVILGQATIPRGDPPAKDDVPRIRGFAAQDMTPGDHHQAQDFVLNFRNVQRNLPELEKAAAGIGLFSFYPDEDNIVRRVPLAVAVNGELYPALSVEALRVVLERMYGKAQSMLLRYDAGGATSISIGPKFKLSTDRTGHAWIYYGTYTRDRYVSAKDVMDGSAPLDKLANSIAILGTSAAGLQDIRATPLSEGLPGVEVHAQILENILSGIFLTRDKYAPFWEVGAIVISGLLIMITLPLGGALWSLAAVLLINVGLVGFSWYKFSEEYRLIGFVYPVLCSVLLYTFLTFMNYVREEQAKKQVRSAFSPVPFARHGRGAGGESRPPQAGRRDAQHDADVFGHSRLHHDLRAVPRQPGRPDQPDQPVPDAHDGASSWSARARSISTWATASWRSGTRRSTTPSMPTTPVDAALTMIAEIERINVAIEQEAKAEGRRFFPIKVGVGINTGEVCRRQHGFGPALRLFGDRRRREPRLAPGGAVEDLWRHHRHRRDTPRAMPGASPPWSST